VSVKIFTFFFGSGAAHHNYRYSTLNFAGPGVGKFSLQQLFSADLETAALLRKYCELDIKRQLVMIDSDIGEIEFWWPEQDYRLWDAFSEFNFDKSGLTLIFSPYDILPFVFGAHEVHVPWDMVRGKIHAAFMNRPLGEVVGGGGL
jgi:hypothetical protein